MPTVLIVNGALGGSTGNTAELLAVAEEDLMGQCEVAHLELAREPSLSRILEEARRADAFLFGTGTYWDSWGSPLQKFFEMTAATEGDDCWLGKPAGAIVTAHAVGAKGVLSRLFGVLNVYGMLLPPMAGIAYTFANHVAAPHANDHLKRELWGVADVKVVCHNLLEALAGGRNWHCWPSNEGLSESKWLDVYSSQDQRP